MKQILSFSFIVVLAICTTPNLMGQTINIGNVVDGPILLGSMTLSAVSDNSPGNGNRPVYFVDVHQVTNNEIDSFMISAIVYSPILGEYKGVISRQYKGNFNTNRKLTICIKDPDIDISSDDIVTIIPYMVDMVGYQWFINTTTLIPFLGGQGQLGGVLKADPPPQPPPTPGGGGTGGSSGGGCTTEEYKDRCAVCLEQAKAICTQGVTKYSCGCGACSIECNIPK